MGRTVNWMITFTLRSIRGCEFNPMSPPTSALRHVSMMHDTLIANMDPSGLRILLRAMLTSGQCENTALFTRISKDILSGREDTELAPMDALRHARCLFAAGLPFQALNVYLYRVLPALGQLPHDSFVALDHDIVQNVQSCSESSDYDSDAVAAFESALLDAQASWRESVEFPLLRGLHALQALRGGSPSVVGTSSHKVHIALSQLPTVSLGRVECPRVIMGLWQMSSPNWGSADVDTIRTSMADLALQGFTAFDMADHYGDAEIRFGDFRSRVSDPKSVIATTKWCVFKPMSVTREAVEDALGHRLRRLQTDSVDLLQFHWNDYNDKGYLEALRHLAHFHDEGKIGAVGLCNFDTEHLVEVCRALPKGFIVSNQVQLSLIDTRPLHGMITACEQHGVKLLTYGTLCGGLLSNRFLNAARPDPYSTTFTTSLRKYLDMINVWGTWDEFQRLLETLHEVAHRHGESISVANVATKWVLNQSAVGAVILGARLGVSSNIEDNARVFQWELTPQDMADIEQAAMLGRGKQLLEYLGDCGGEYR